MREGFLDGDRGTRIVERLLYLPPRIGLPFGIVLVDRREDAVLLGLAEVADAGRGLLVFLVRACGHGPRLLWDERKVGRGGRRGKGRRGGCEVRSSDPCAIC